MAQREYNKRCIICNTPFVAKHNKALYCSKLSCKENGKRNRLMLERSFIMSHQIAVNELGHKIDFLIEMLSDKLDFVMPKTFKYTKESSNEFEFGKGKKSKKKLVKVDNEVIFVKEKSKHDMMKELKEKYKDEDEE